MTMLIASTHLAVATDLAEALQWRQAHPEATVIAGGTEVLADVALDERHLKGCLHIGRIAELQTVSISSDTIQLGAATTMERLTHSDIAAASPMLAQVASSIGTPQARRRGTVGGNLGSGQPDRSLAPALLALGCDVVLQSHAHGERRVPLAGFLEDRGRTSLGADELITGLVVQRCSGFQAFTMVGPRPALVYPTVSSALVVDPDRCTLALGLGNAGATALRSSNAEALASSIDWKGCRISDALAEQFGDLAAADTSPIDDVQASADYRRHAVAVMARRLLQRAFTSHA